jgi:Bacterial extracellular solute-binding protein
MAMPLSRRTFIRNAAIGAAGLPLLLEACTPPVPGSGGVAGATAKPTALMPTYLPLQNKPRPDYPAPSDLGMDGYDNYPSNPAKALPAQPPGQGGTVTSLTVGVLPPHAPLESNAAWQEINRQLGVDFKFNVVPAGEYQAKMATVMAGGDLPDLLFFYYQQQTAVTTVPGVPQFLTAQAADLTSYLAGDAIKDYPNLGNIPTYAWKNSGSVYNGRIQMVPRPHQRRQRQSGADRTRQSGRGLPAVQVHRAATTGAVFARPARLCARGPRGGKAAAPPRRDRPTVGFVSPTAVSKGLVLQATMLDGVRDIIAGRRPLAEYDQLVNEWRTGGGEQMRTELQNALAAAT